MPRIFYSLRRLKFSRCPFHSSTIFKAYVIKLIPYDFLKFTFLHFSPQVKLSFLGGRKRKPKIFGFENVTDRGIRKVVTFEKLHMASKIVGKIILKPS